MMNALRYAGVALGIAVSLTPRASAQQVDTVRVGSAALEIARLELGTYAIESFRRSDGHDVPISTTTQTIVREAYGDFDAYVVRTVHATADGDTTIGVIIARTSDLALLHHRVKADRDSAAVAVTEGHLTGWVVLPGEPVSLIDQRLERPVFPIEGQVPWLFTLLPLDDGYAAAVPHYSQWAQREEWSLIRVVGTESLTRNGREWDCWKVDGGELFPGYRVTYWVDKHTRRVVQGVARGADEGPEFWSRMRTP